MKVDKIVSVAKPVKKVVKEIYYDGVKRTVEIGKSGLPKEWPVEKLYYITTSQDTFEKLKDANQVVIDNMRK